MTSRVQASRISGLLYSVLDIGLRWAVVLTVE